MNPTPQPSDLGAERTIIGGVLVHPTVLTDVLGLQPEDFYDPRHAAAWRAIRELDDTQAPIDVVSVLGRMATGGGPRVGEDFLTALMGGVVTVENLDYHARRLKLLARRRRWLAFCRKAAVQAADGGVDTEDFINDAEREALALAAEAEEGGGPKHLYPILKDVTRDLEKRAESKSTVTGIPSGFTELDGITGGWKGGDLIVIGARPSMGKTAFALNNVASAIVTEYPSLIFSLEMSAPALAERLLGREALVSSQALRRGRMDQSIWIGINKAASQLSVRPLWIDDRGEVDVHAIRSTARRWRAQQKRPGIIVVDYLQLIGSRPVKGQQPNREREIAVISRQLKLLAKEVDCPVFALSQLNRSLESRADKRPMLSDLRESGAIEQDADVIIFLYRDVVYDKKTATPDLLEAIVAKQRNGPTGDVNLRWHGATQRIYDYEDAPASAPSPQASFL